MSKGKNSAAIMVAVSFIWCGHCDGCEVNANNKRVVREKIANFAGVIESEYGSSGIIIEKTD